MSNSVINPYNFAVAALPVALDGTPQQNSVNSAVTSLSQNITVGNNVNKALVCCIYRQGGGVTGTTAVKVGVNSFTLMVQTFGSVTGTGTQTAEIWYLLDSGITNDAVNQVDWTGTGAGRVGIGVYSLYNVNQSGGASTFTSAQAFNTSAGYSNQPDGVINGITADDFILDQLASNSATIPAFTLTEGWTEQVKVNRYSVSQYDATPSINNNMFYTNIDAAEWAWSGVGMKSG